MFKALHLALWHDLLDAKRAEALEDRASFRLSCGFAAQEAAPGGSAFVPFHRSLIGRGLDRRLFEAVSVQFKVRAFTVKTGTVVGVMIIASASGMTTRRAG